MKTPILVEPIEKAEDDTSVYVAMLWTGHNLKEFLDFAGRHPKFDEWFQNFEVYERFVEDSGYLFRIFCEDGTKLSVFAGNVVVKRGGEIRIVPERNFSYEYRILE